MPDHMPAVTGANNPNTKTLKFQNHLLLNFIHTSIREKPGRHLQSPSNPYQHLQVGQQGCNVQRHRTGL